MAPSLKLLTGFLKVQSCTPITYYNPSQSTFLLNSELVLLLLLLLLVTFMLNPFFVPEGQNNPRPRPKPKLEEGSHVDMYGILLESVTF